MIVVEEGEESDNEVPASRGQQEQESNDDEDLEPIEPPAMLQESFPIPPQFETYSHQAPEHPRIIRLPDNFSVRYRMVEPSTSVEQDEAEGEYSERDYRVTPGSFFKLFFTPEVFAELAENTNNYADMKHSHLPSTSRGRR